MKTLKEFLESNNYDPADLTMLDCSMHMDHNYPGVKIRLEMMPSRDLKPPAPAETEPIIHKGNRVMIDADGYACEFRDGMGRTVTGYSMTDVSAGETAKLYMGGEWVTDMPTRPMGVAKPSGFTVKIDSVDKAGPTLKYFVKKESCVGVFNQHAVSSIRCECGAAKTGGQCYSWCPTFNAAERY